MLPGGSGDVVGLNARQNHFPSLDQEVGYRARFGVDAVGDITEVTPSSMAVSGVKSDGADLDAEGLIPCFRRRDVRSPVVWRRVPG